MINEKVLLQSRPEALNDMMDLDLQNQKGGYNNGWNDCLFMFIDIIKKQPKVGEWIPVSERLPEEHDSIFAKCTEQINGAMRFGERNQKRCL